MIPRNDNEYQPKPNDLIKLDHWGDADAVRVLRVVDGILHTTGGDKYGNNAGWKRVEVSNLFNIRRVISSTNKVD